jgi:predicted ATPase/DNA-binding SARP family transcriptional activator
MDVALELRFFGKFSLKVRGETQPVAKPAQELLAQLAIAGARGLDRWEAATTLWPDAEPERAQFYLRRYLTDLRANLGSERSRLESSDNHRIALDLADCDCDLDRFEREGKAVEHSRLKLAADAYGGDLLVGHRSEWVRQARQACKDRYVSILIRLATQDEKEGRLDSAVSRLLAASRADPIREDVAQKLMQLFQMKGQATNAARVFGDLRERLRSQVGLPPSAETISVWRQILAEAKLVDLGQPDAQSRHQSLVPLPGQTSPLIGREAERQSLRKRLSQHRLVTVIGPGGVGKTRLVQEVARELSGDFGGFVAHLDLSSCLKSDEVSDRAVRTLGLFSLEQARERFGAHDSLLLVIDGAEQVAGACAYVVSKLLNDLSRLRVLCTSQVALLAPGEHVYALKPLALPQTGAEMDEATTSEAVRFFLSAAERSADGFCLTHENLEDVVEVTRRLDGLPLALELAAVRLRSISVRDMVEHLKEGFGLLDAGYEPGRGGRSLQSVLDWSFRLLSDAEQKTFIKLGVFPARWTLASAASVCGEPGEDVTAILSKLVDHSLVAFDRETSSFHMLETVRSYAREALSKDPKLYQIMRQRHAAVYWHPKESDYGDRRAAFLADQENFAASVEFFLESNDPSYRQLALGLVNRLFPIWYRVGLVSDGLNLALSVIGRLSGDESDALAEALFRAASAAHWLFNITLADELFTRAERMADALNLQVWSNESLRGRGELAANEGRLDDAERLLGFALSRFRGAGDTYGEASCLGMLGYVERQRKNLAKAVEFTEMALELHVVNDHLEGRLWCMGSLAAIRLEESAPNLAKPILLQTLALQEKAGNVPAQAWNLTMLGVTCMRLDELEAAEEFLQRSLRLQGEDEEDLRRAWPLIELADLAQRRRRLDLAKAFLDQALTLCRKGGSTQLEARALLLLASTAAESGESASARGYRAAAAELLNSLQSPHLSDRLRILDEQIAALRSTVR